MVVRYGIAGMDNLWLEIALAYKVRDTPKLLAFQSRECDTILYKFSVVLWIRYQIAPV